MGRKPSYSLEVMADVRVKFGVVAPIICEGYQITMDELRARGKDDTPTRARMMLYVLLVERGCPISYVSRLVNRKHSTAYRALQLAASDHEVQTTVDEFRRAVATALGPMGDNPMSIESVIKSKARRFAGNRQLSDVVEYVRGPLLGVVKRYDTLSAMRGLWVLAKHSGVRDVVREALISSGFGPWAPNIELHIAQARLTVSVNGRETNG